MNRQPTPSSTHRGRSFRAALAIGCCLAGPLLLVPAPAAAAPAGTNSTAPKSPSAGSRLFPAQTAQPRVWRLGETIEADVITPEPLAVFNPEQTEALRQAELPRVSPVFRHDPGAVKAAEAELRKRFASARSRFLEIIAAAFQRRTTLSVSDLAEPRFQEGIALFRTREPGFPLSPSLAELWALGDPGQVVLDDFAAKLRRFMGAYLRADPLPEGETLQVSSIRILPIDAPPINGGVADTNALPRGTTISRNSIYSLGRYRRELAAVTPAPEQAVVSWVAGFIRANCTFDAPATALYRQRRLQAINAIDHYPAGAAIARRGQAVDARTKRALETLATLQSRDQAREAELAAAQLGADLVKVAAQAGALRSTAELNQLQATAAAEAARLARAEADAIESRNRLLAWSLGGATVAGLFFASLWLRHRAQRRRLEQRLDLAIVAGEHPANEADLWRARALAAEARADKATAVLRTQLLPHLARWMMTEMMQRLLSQRSLAQSSQQRAEQEVTELAARLEKLHAPLEERLRAYERRIAELEAELATRDAQNLELIQARIESTRRQLETERAAQPALN